MFVCLVPYSSSLISDFESDWIANLFFNANLFIIGVLYWINWIYATKHNRLVNKNLNVSIVKNGSKRGKIFILVSGLAIILSLIVPLYSGYAYLLLIIFYNRKIFYKINF